ncbi:hypothetical protein C1646_712128 [Rhizophagus diaphanus]|nr:hypothetical protein C1646_712128 [Rhizophagus diaphanus] [Rhizophagus sp. MUCL 43196]
MSSENFKNTEFEPIKQILTYLKNCDAILSGSAVLDIDKHINIIIEQEKEFHIFLQKSIVQSNNFKDALDNLEILNNPNFEQNHVSDILQIHTNNVEEIIHKLWELYEIYKITEISNKRELQSLKHKKEDLEKDLKSLKQYTIIHFIVVGINLLIFQSISDSELLASGIAIMIISALIKKINIRQTENEINKLQKIGNELEKFCNKLGPLIVNIYAFSMYRVTLENFSRDLLGSYFLLIGHNSTDNHYNRILIKPTKLRWEKVKKLCDNYIRTVCRTSTDNA